MYFASETAQIELKSGRVFVSPCHESVVQLGGQQHVFQVVQVFEDERGKQPGGAAVVAGIARVGVGTLDVAAQVEFESASSYYGSKR